MQAAAICSDSQLSRVPIAITTGRRVRVAGVLRARPPLEEVPFVPPADGGHQMRTLRAFIVHGPALERDGVRDGDQLLIESTHVPPVGTTILAIVGGQFTLQRIIARSCDGALTLAPAGGDQLALAENTSECRVLGTFVGLLRKRGFARRPYGSEQSSGIVSDLPQSVAIRKRTASKTTVLRNQLRMLERIRLDTRNPRLQRALRGEVERVRLLLQNGAPSRTAGQ